jgi:hypothetical protein
MASERAAPCATGRRHRTRRLRMAPSQPQTGRSTVVAAVSASTRSSPRAGLWNSTAAPERLAPAVSTEGPHRTPQPPPGPEPAIALPSVLPPADDVPAPRLVVLHAHGCSLVVGHNWGTALCPSCHRALPQKLAPPRDGARQERENPAGAGLLESAPKRTRTSTRLSRTRPSTWRVYQFRHRREGSRSIAAVPGPGALSPRTAARARRAAPGGTAAGRRG